MQRVATTDHSARPEGDQRLADADPSGVAGGGASDPTGARPVESTARAASDPADAHPVESTSDADDGDRARARASLRRSPFVIAGSYAAAASVWILASDRLIGALVSDPGTLVRLSVMKGFAFIAVTAVLLLVLLRGSMSAIERSLLAVDAKEAERRHHDLERRRAEGQLRLANELLEETVRERTRELEAALARAERADHVKSAFLATMSHELRTPLNSIIGFSGILLQGLAGPLNAEQTKQLGMVKASSEHLLALINDVLDLSRIEAGQMPIELMPVDVPAAVRRSVEVVRPAATEKSLALELFVADGVDVVLTDERRLEEILLNLLSNAVKFTERGVVHVEATADGDRLTIRVTDTGPGIREEARGALFEPFSQLEGARGQRHRGTGLGLSISKRLAELLGGSIWVESEWGVGSTFAVELPLRRPSS